MGWGVGLSKSVLCLLFFPRLIHLEAFLVPACVFCESLCAPLLRLPEEMGGYEMRALWRRGMGMVLVGWYDKYKSEMRMRLIMVVFLAMFS